MDPSYQSTLSKAQAHCRLRPRTYRGAVALLVLCLTWSCKRKDAARTPAVVAHQPPSKPVMPEAIPSAQVPDLPALHELLRSRLSRVEHFQALDPDLFAQYSRVLQSALAGGQDANVVASSPAIKLERVSLQNPRIELMCLSEQGTKGTGLPQVLWREPNTRTKGGWLLQAPHRFFDRRTGEVALALFATQDPRNARVLCLNSKHRYAQKDGKRKKTAHNPSDVCHNAGHGFQRVTQALMVAMNSSDIVQIHGFGSKRGGRDEALAIVSSGDPKQASPRALALVQSLRKTFGDKILLFPRDTSLLGATTNVQGQILRTYASRDLERSQNGFLHIEMSEALRERLLSDATALNAFREALLGVMKPEAQGPL